MPSDVVSLPRLAVISEVIPESAYAGSLLLQRLFATYPADRLLVVGPKPQTISATLPCRYLEFVQPGTRLYRSRFAPLVRSLETYGAFPQPRIPSAARRELDRFAPQGVVSVMQTQACFRLAQRTARRLRIPLHLIVHDLPEALEPVYRWAAGKQHANNGTVYRAAANRFCISDAMVEHCAAHYRADGTVLYPNRSDDLAPRAVEEAGRLRQGETLTIGYAGTLAYGYGETLARLARDLPGSRCRLRLYTKESPEWATSDAVDWVGYAAAAQTWDRVKTECDAVVLPYSWNESDKQDLYRTHFPSKLPEYLQLGLPVLILGPPHATGVRWGLRNPDAAETVAADDPARWRAALDHLRTTPSRRTALAEGGVRAGARDFDPDLIRERFLRTLQQSVDVDRTSNPRAESR